MKAVGVVHDSVFRDRFIDIQKRARDGEPCFLRFSGGGEFGVVKLAQGGALRRGRWARHGEAEGVIELRLDIRGCLLYTSPSPRD